MRSGCDQRDAAKEETAGRAVADPCLEDEDMTLGKKTRKLRREEYANGAKKDDLLWRVYLMQRRKCAMWRLTAARSTVNPD